MIVETSTHVVRSVLSVLLTVYKMDNREDSDVALDVIEFIALRMREHQDHQVAEMGTFVRACLIGYFHDRLSYEDAHERLVAAALYAPLGHVCLREAFRCSSGRP